jgi:MFS family permease
LFPVRQFIARSNASGTLAQENSGKVIRTMLFGAGLAGVALLGTWGSVQRAPTWAGDLGKAAGIANATAWTQIWLSAGAIFGTIVAAVAADYLGRRLTYALICILSMVSCVAMYQLNDSFGPKFEFFAFLMGGTTAAMYGFFPLYFPELFPTSMRATGQGFCFNFGRVIAAVGGLQTATLIAAFGGSFPKAGTVMSAIYLIGAVLIWFGPETKGKPLPE